jgi:group I intron endonuclease
MDNRSGIYAIRNRIDGRAYIGSSYDIESRKTKHLWQLRKGAHHNVFLQRAYDKYGEGSISFDILEYCHRDNLLQKEQRYLDQEENLYNICDKAGAGPGATSHSSSTKEKMRESALRRDPPTVATRKKLSKAATGRRLCSSTKDKIRKSLLGTRNPRSRSVEQFDLKGNSLAKYSTIKEAVEKTGIKHISQACRGVYKQAGGYVWKYI